MQDRRNKDARWSRKNSSLEFQIILPNEIRHMNSRQYAFSCRFERNDFFSFTLMLDFVCNQRNTESKEFESFRERKTQRKDSG